jgi:hypothetical protein
MPHFAYAVPCHFCGAEPSDLCRHTMLPDNPPTDVHSVRVEFAESELFDA